MSDLIERKDAIEVLAWHMYDVALLKADGRLDTMDSYRKSAEITMRHIPSADRPKSVDLTNVYQTGYDNGYARGKADRPRGEWIMSDIQNEADVLNGNYAYVCTNCNHTDIHAKTQKVPYCWWCGARMKGADDE